MFPRFASFKPNHNLVIAHHHQRRRRLNSSPPSSPEDSRLLSNNMHASTSRIPSSIQRPRRQQQYQTSQQEEGPYTRAIPTRPSRRSSVRQQHMLNKKDMLADETFQIPTGSGSVLLAEYDEEDFFGEFGAGIDESVLALTTPVSLRHNSSRAAHDYLLSDQETPKPGKTLEEEDVTAPVELKFDEEATPSSLLEHTPRVPNRDNTVVHSAFPRSPLARGSSPLPPSSEASQSPPQSPPRVCSPMTKMAQPTHVPYFLSADPPVQTPWHSSLGQEEATTLTKSSGGFDAKHVPIKDALVLSGKPRGSNDMSDGRSDVLDNLMGRDGEPDEIEHPPSQPDIQELVSTSSKQPFDHAPSRNREAARESSMEPRSTIRVDEPINPTESGTLEIDASMIMDKDSVYDQAELEAHDLLGVHVQPKQFNGSPERLAVSEQAPIAELGTRPEDKLPNHVVSVSPTTGPCEETCRFETGKGKVAVGPEHVLNADVAGLGHSGESSHTTIPHSITGLGSKHVVSDTGTVSQKRARKRDQTQKRKVVPLVDPPASKRVVSSSANASSSGVPITNKPLDRGVTSGAKSAKADANHQETYNAGSDVTTSSTLETTKTKAASRATSRLGTGSCGPTPMSDDSRPAQKKAEEIKEQRADDMFERKKRDNYLQKGLDLTSHSTVRFRSAAKLGTRENCTEGVTKEKSTRSKPTVPLKQDVSNKNGKPTSSRHHHDSRGRDDEMKPDNGSHVEFQHEVKDAGNLPRVDMIGDEEEKAHQQELLQEGGRTDTRGQDEGAQKTNEEKELANNSRRSLGGAIAERLTNFGQKVMGTIGFLSLGSEEALDAVTAPSTHAHMDDIAPLQGSEVATEGRRRSDLRLSELDPTPRKTMPADYEGPAEILEHTARVPDQSSIGQQLKQFQSSRTRTVSPMKSSRKRPSRDNDDGDDGCGHGQVRTGGGVGVGTGTQHSSGSTENDRKSKRAKIVKTTKVAPARPAQPTITKRSAVLSRSTAVKRRALSVTVKRDAATRPSASSSTKVEPAKSKPPLSSSSSKPVVCHNLDGKPVRTSPESYNDTSNLNAATQFFPSIETMGPCVFSSVSAGLETSSNTNRPTTSGISANSNAPNAESDDGSTHDGDVQLGSLSNSTSANADSTDHQDGQQGAQADMKKKREHSKVERDAGTLACVSTEDAPSHTNSSLLPPAPADRCRLTIPVAPSFAGDVIRKNSRSASQSSTSEPAQEHGKAKARVPLTEKVTFNVPQTRPTIPHEFRFSTDIRVERRRQDFDEKLKVWEQRCLAKSESATSSKPPRDYAPIPDFKALQAAYEATQTARREKLKPAPTVPVAFNLVTDQRLAEREKFEEARRIRELVIEREREEKRRVQEEQEEREWRETRKKTVMKANPVPEWYAGAPKKVKTVATPELATDSGSNA